MAGDKVVVEYASIEGLANTYAQQKERLAAVFDRLEPVGSQTLYANKLDDALSAYRSALKTVRDELFGQVDGLRQFMLDAAHIYEEVDRYAGTRATPYDPNNPAPSLVVPPTSTGTAVPGVPSGPDGSGTPVKLPNPPVGGFNYDGNQYEPPFPGEPG